jgi:hypothetical protein
MPKAYWVTAYRSISDPGKLAAYAKLAPDAIAPFGGRYLVRGTAAAAYEAGQRSALSSPNFRASRPPSQPTTARPTRPRSRNLAMGQCGMCGLWKDWNRSV